MPPRFQSLLLDIHARLLSAGTDHEEVLDGVVGLLARALGCPAAWIALADASGTLHIEAVGGTHPQLETLPGQALPHSKGLRGETLAYRCLRTGKTAQARDAVAELPITLPPGATAVLPLASGAAPHGVLGLRAAPGRSFRQGELAFLETVATHLAAVLALRARVAAADEALAHRHQAAAVFDSAMEGIFITDLNGRILAANPAACRITGYDAAEVLGATPALFKSGRHDQAFYEAFWASLRAYGCWRGEIWNRRKNGEIYPELLCVSAIHDDSGQAVRFVALLIDISEQKRIESELARKAYYDQLTGLPNRGLFEDYLAKVLARARREGSTVAVLFFDLDDFKYVNDTLGHDEGDRLIRTVAERLAACLRSEDMVARLGGDEFVVALPGIPHMHDAATVARKLLDSVCGPVALGTDEVYVSGCIGIALFPDDGDSPDLLLRCADNAMYGAKELGSNSMLFYRPEMHTRSGERFAIGSALKNALGANEFFLVYQPQFRAGAQRPVGVEALLRWRHNGEVITPDRFIPLSEEKGLIVEVGEWVLRTACTQGRLWHEQGFSDLRVAVNLSARQFRERTLVPMIYEVLEETGFPPAALEIEITESLTLSNANSAPNILGALKEMGVGIAIDDFGTGYSSLACLGRYPIDTLKIDLSFVQAIGRDPRVEAIICAIVAMAGTLGIALVAEGVETEAQRDFLLGRGCDVIQGYLVGKPMLPQEFDAHFASGLLPH
ncbi:bifunctional diguanylate cyclase/phosphodiesterase [Pseudothauera rhizosphaerae]|nr:EAL domain-containing protein [Pseudothauera rhizosphaerae]